MYSIAFLVIGAVQLWFAVQAWQLFRRARNWYILIALANLLALTYDCTMIGLGRFIGEGPLLRALNAPRFIMHALITPLLIIFIFGVMRRVGFGWAQSRIMHALFCTFALILVLVGSREDILHLSLAPKTYEDTVRYVNLATTGPPLPAILVIIVFLVMGVLLWVRTKSPWVFLGSLFMFICAPLGAKLPLVGNIGELGISAALIAAEKQAQVSTQNGLDN